jgi:hypothetical protein
MVQMQMPDDSYKSGRRIFKTRKMVYVVAKDDVNKLITLSSLVDQDSFSQRLFTVKVAGIILVMI